jgi:putative membrane protein
MMKSILRKIIFYSVALFVTTQALSGVQVTGGLAGLALAGLVLSVLFILVKPVLSLITLPLNIITLGLFSFIINAIILYLLTIIVPGVSIAAFRFNGLSFFGFVIPSFPVNNFFAFILASVFISFIVGFLKWLTKE